MNGTLPEEEVTPQENIGARQPSGFQAFLTAVQFLLISPAFKKGVFSPQELGASVGYYPLVGLILGVILIGADLLLGRIFPPLVRAALVLAIWILLTGALHLDGFLDSCDGLLGGSDPQKRMEIMRDERVGAYALSGGSLLLLIKFSALATLGGRSDALLLAPVLGRWAIAVALTTFPYAREVGLGREMKDHAGRRQAVRASVFGLVIVCALSLWHPAAPIIAALGASALGGWLVIRFALNRLPGLTGDIYGALNEIVEALVLLVFAGFYR